MERKTKEYVPQSVCHDYDEMAKLFVDSADKLLEAFIFYDKNGDATIEATELKPLIQHILGGNAEINGDQVQMIINVFDENENGEMDLMEFCEFFSFVFKMVIRKNIKSQYCKYIE